MLEKRDALMLLGQLVSCVHPLITSPTKYCLVCDTQNLSLHIPTYVTGYLHLKFSSYSSVGSKTEVSISQFVLPLVSFLEYIEPVGVGDFSLSIIACMDLYIYYPSSLLQIRHIYISFWKDFRMDQLSKGLFSVLT